MLKVRSVPIASWRLFQNRAVKLRTSIRDYGFRDSMKTNNLGDIKLCIFLNRVVGFDWKKVSRFCKTIHNDPNGIVPMNSTRKPGNKIYGYILSLPRRNRKRLESSGWLEMFGLHSLANIDSAT